MSPSAAKLQQIQSSINELTEKLGHPIDEIRARALSSLRFKLHMNILTLADLVHEKPLMKAIFEWFNFPGALQDQTSVRTALEFILQLAKYPKSKQILLDMNALHFLRMLRKDLAMDELQSLVDQVTQQLLFVSSDAAATLAPSERPPSTLVPTEGRLPALVAYQHRAQAEISPREKTRARAVGTERYAMAPSSDIQRMRRMVVPSLEPPPRIPNSLPIALDYIHLSPVDEAFVNDFHHLMTTQSSRADLFEKLRWGFDVLCYDFGSPLFLQKTHLLSALVNGIHRPEEEGKVFLVMLQKLSRQWLLLFQQADTLRRSVSSATFVNNTPDVSYTATASQAHDATSSVAERFNDDQSISMVFACYEIFSRASPLLKEPTRVYSVINILSDILPLIKLYVDSITVTNGVYDMNAYTAHALYFVGSIVECMVYYHSEQDVDMDPVQAVLIRRSLSSFLMDTLDTFAPESNNDVRLSVYWPCLNFVTQMVHYPLSSILAQACLDPKSNDQGGLTDIYIHLLTHEDSECILVALNALLDCLSRKSDVANSEILFVLLTETLVDDDESVRKLALSATAQLMRTLDAVPSFQSMYRLLQSHYNLDKGQLLAQLQTSSHHLVDQRFFLEIGLRGLFHIDEQYRKESASLISSWSKSRSTPRFFISQTWNAFVFDNTEEQIKMDRAETLPSTEKLTIDELMSKLQQPLEVEIASKLLSRLHAYLLDPLTRQECISKNVTNILISFLGKIPDIASTSIALSWEKAACVTFSMLRMCAELINDCDLWDLLQREDVIAVIAQYAFLDDSSLRYEIARFAFLLLFQPRMIRAFDGRKSKQYDRDVFAPTSQEGGYQSFVQLLPRHVAENFLAFGSIEKVFQVRTSEVQFTVIEAVTIKRAVSANRTVGPWDTLISVSQAIEALEKARSHSAFGIAMQQFELMTVSYADLKDLDPVRCLKLFKKFLLVPPASRFDASLFIRIVTLLTRLIGAQTNLTEDCWAILAESIRTNLLRMLDKEAVLDDECEGYPQDISVTDVVLKFVRRTLEIASDSQLEKLIRTSQMVDVTKALTVRCFSKQQSSLSDREHRIQCLSCLMRILRLKALIQIVQSSAVCGIIALLTQTLGCLQQNFEASDAFSHQDRTIYRLVVISLRCCSRMIVEPSDHFDGAWGPHWLFNGGLDWLVNLLSDDEIKIQKYGLGIISNLILIRESYQSIMLKIPNFLDMAFAFTLDADRPDGIRKEALLVVNNFFVRFCHDTALSGIQVPQGKTADDMEQILKVFENCLFFDRLKEILDDRYFVLTNASALTELLLNLSCAAPKYVQDQFAEHDCFTSLLAVLRSKNEVDHILANAPTKTTVPSYESFRMRRFYQLRGVGWIRAQIDVLAMFRLLCNDDATRKMFVSSPYALRAVSSLLNDVVTHNDLVISEACPELYNTRTSSICLTLAESLKDFYVHNVNVLIQTLGPSFTSSLLNYAVISCSDPRQPQSRDLIFLLSKIIALHGFIEPVDARLRAALRTAYGETDVGCNLIHIAKAHYCYQVTKNGSDKNVTTFAVGCLQLLLEMTDIDEQSYIAELSANGFSRFSIEHLCSIVSGPVAGPIAVEVTSISKLIVQFVTKESRHLQSLFHKQMMEILRKTQLGKEMPEERSRMLSINTLQVILQLYDGSFEAKRFMVDNSSELPAEMLAEIRAKEGKRNIPLPANQSALEIMKFILFRLDLKKAATCDIFRLIVAIMISALEHEGVRSLMVKSNILAEFQTWMKFLLKKKEFGRIEILLHFFMNLTQHQETHGALFHLTGFVADLVSLMDPRVGTRSSLFLTLLVVRNLSFQKEFKAFFLNDENFLPTLRDILKLNMPEDVCAAVTAVVWMLVYDCQKAKSLFKNGQIVPLIQRLESQSFLTKEGSYGEQIAKQLEAIKELMR